MSTGSVQRRNDEMVSLLESDFCRWREFMADGARLLSAVQATHRQGGGMFRFGWLADRLGIFTRDGMATLTGINVTDVDFAATNNGGPYVNLNGTTEYLDGGDVTWAEPGANKFLVWQWAYLSAVTLAAHTIVSKRDTAPNAEWSLEYNAGPANYLFYITGAVMAISTYAGVATGQWLFVAGYYEPSNLLRIFVGAATDAALTIDSNVAGIPAALSIGTAAFRIGDMQQVGNFFWNGKLGVLGGRTNVPAAAIDGHVSRLFHMTRWKYIA